MYGAKSEPEDVSIDIPQHDRIQEAAERVGREVGARLIVLFGSAARSDGGGAEDLDIGVLADAALDAVAVTNRFIQLLETQNIDVADLRRADPLLLMLVARDGVPLFQRTSGEFARFWSLAARRYADTRKFRVAEREEIRDFVARGLHKR